MKPFSSKGHGFTLIELMVTVAMIAILVVVTIPSVMKAVSQREVVNATSSVQDIIDFARVQAAVRNRAYRITPVLGTGLGNCGRLLLHENTSPACLGFNVVGADGSTSTLVRTLDIGAVFPTISLVAASPDLNTSPLCIKPDGRVFQVVSDTTPIMIPSAGTGYAAGDARFNLQRYGRNGPEGPAHVVVVPFSGSTRVEFQ